MAGRGVRRWTVTLQPGQARRVVAADWSDALVVVATGALEIECCTGRQVVFSAGSVLTLAGLSVRCVRNPGPSVLVLCAVTREHPGDDGRPTDR